MEINVISDYRKIIKRKKNNIIILGYALKDELYIRIPCLYYYVSDKIYPLLYYYLFYSFNE